MSSWLKRTFGFRTFVDFEIGCGYVVDWSEPEEWCKRNLDRHDYEMVWLEAPYQENLCDGIRFVNKEDAVAFKLRFGL